MSRSANAAVTAVYSGTFDPLTLGHEDAIRRAAQMFDQVIIAVAVAHHKKTVFSLDERVALAIDGLIVEFVRAQNAQVIVRGLRSLTDYDYETQMSGMNRHLAPEIDTVFLYTSAHVQHISSTLVREIAKLGGDVSGLVSAPVLNALQAKVATKQ